MVVYIDNEVLAKEVINPSPPKLLQELLANSVIKQKVDTFLNEMTQKRICNHSLFVCQGEYSGVSFSKADQIAWIGTSGATTCHIVVIHDNDSVALAHIDSPNSVDNTIENMISGMGHELSLYVVGGFSEEKMTSYSISSCLLEYFYQSEKHFNIQLWCTLDLNTKISDELSYPILTDVAFRLEDRSLHNVVFDYRGPELELRSLLRQDSVQDFNIFDKETCLIKIPYVEFEMDPRYRGAASAPDNFLLSRCSTSPYCEPDYFCQDMRNFFLFIATKDSNMVFGPNKEPMIYEMNNDGVWVRQDIT